MGNSSSNETSKSDTSSNCSEVNNFDIFEYESANSEDSTKDSREKNEKDTKLEIYEKNSSCILNDIVSNVINEIENEIKFNKKIEISVNKNTKNLDLDVIKSRYFLLKKINTPKILFKDGTLHYAFLNSLNYTNVEYQINKNDINNNLESIVSIPNRKIKFYQIGNNIDLIIKNILRNKPVIFTYNLLEGVDSSNWFIDNFERKRKIKEFRNGVIIGYDFDFKIFKVFDEKEKYFPFDIIQNDLITYKIFSYNFVIE